MQSLKRMLFAINSAKKNKDNIRKILKSPKFHANNITKIKPKSLQQQGNKVLVLDFDGVLAAHGQNTLNPETIKWLEQALTIFPNTTYLLSNNPKAKRFEWLQNKFPQIHLISGIKKKPYPDGLEAIIKDAQVKPGQVILVDDRLLTGVLASINAHTNIIYITHLI